MTDQAPGVTKAVSHLYQVFSDYPRPHTASGCTHCYDPEEFEYLRSTPLSSLSPTMTRTLLWETGDHWESTAAYKHYLPRLLEAMSPSLGIGDLYPEHVFETLAFHDFGGWPPEEHTAVLAYFEALEQRLEDVPGLDDEVSRGEWRLALERLRGLRSGSE